VCSRYRESAMSNDGDDIRKYINSFRISRERNIKHFLFTILSFIFKWINVVFRSVCSCNCTSCNPFFSKQKPGKNALIVKLLNPNRSSVNKSLDPCSRQSSQWGREPPDAMSLRYADTSLPELLGRPSLRFAEMSMCNTSKCACVIQVGLFIVFQNDR